MKLKDIMEASEHSWNDFLRALEDAVGSKLSRKEGYQAYREWEQGGVSVIELARWISSDRSAGEYKHQDTDTEAEDDNFDYTKYSMRQGELGNQYR